MLSIAAFDCEINYSLYVMSATVDLRAILMHTALHSESRSYWEETNYCEETKARNPRTACVVTILSRVGMFSWADMTRYSLFVVKVSLNTNQPTR